MGGFGTVPPHMNFPTGSSAGLLYYVVPRVGALEPLELTGPGRARPGLLKRRFFLGGGDFFAPNPGTSTGFQNSYNDPPELSRTLTQDTLRGPILRVGLAVMEFYRIRLARFSICAEIGIGLYAM